MKAYLILPCLIFVALVVGAMSKEQSKTFSIDRTDYITAVDCEWLAQARAFVDTNKNGKWDTGEIPLENVHFSVNDTLKQLTDIAPEIVSDVKGIAHIKLEFPDCPKVALEIYAQPPSGYTLVTPSHLAQHSNSSEPYDFGFEKR